MVPTPAKLLFHSLREHITALEGSLHLVSKLHRNAGKELALWISGQVTRGAEANVIVICTGNSRRSVLGSVMGNIAASFHNIPKLRFYSGGTDPSAFNRRTVRALQEIGVDVIATGNETPHGDAEPPNPFFKVSWGSGETLEFSKVYSDPHNPQRGFAALLVCTEADGACPSVMGASARIPCPFVDPKEADDSLEEAACYAEKRDEIGRFMMLVAREVAEAGKK